MSFHSNVAARSFIASGDLSGLLYRAVDLLGGANFKVGVAGAGGGFGILLNKPRDGEHASVAVVGEQEVRVGAALSAGDYVTSAASGWIVAVTSGAAQNILGRMVTGAASGMIGALELRPQRVNTAV